MSIKHTLTSPKLRLKNTSNELELCRKGIIERKSLICTVSLFKVYHFIVLLGLIQLGRQQAQRRDLKTMADTWKQLSKLAIDFRTVYELLQHQEQMETNDISENLLDWVELFIQNICELISENVKKMIAVR